MTNENEYAPLHQIAGQFGLTEIEAIKFLSQLSFREPNGKPSESALKGRLARRDEKFGDYDLYEWHHKRLTDMFVVFGHTRKPLCFLGTPIGECRARDSE